MIFIYILILEFLENSKKKTVERLSALKFATKFRKLQYLHFVPGIIEHFGNLGTTLEKRAIKHLNAKFTDIMATNGKCVVELLNHF